MTLMGTDFPSAKGTHQMPIPSPQEKFPNFLLAKQYSSILSPFHSLFINWISIFVTLNVVDHAMFFFVSICARTSYTSNFIITISENNVSIHQAHAYLRLLGSL